MSLQLEIVNPSDPYSMSAADLKIAAVAICLLGNGRYGAKDSAGNFVVPCFVFGGHDEWFDKTFGMNYQTTAEQVMERYAPELIAAFDSVTLRRKERSSMNDIGGKARDLATALRKTINALAKLEAKGQA